MGLWVKAQGAEGFEGEKEISLIMKFNPHFIAQTTVLRRLKAGGSGRAVDKQ